jgi:signal transduction histidine kinase
MTTDSDRQGNARILIVDDNPAIHDDFRKILCATDTDRPELDALEADLFGSTTTVRMRAEFEIDSAYQGRDGLVMVRRALEEGRAYAMAFVDVRMPPGWDGIETLEQIWQVDPDMQAVICTAHTEYSWEDVARRLGHAEDLLILKKPFETVEVLQMAHALTRKWALAREARLRMEDLDRMVRLRTQELVDANRNLEQQVDERRRVQEALRGSEERFSTAFRMGPIPLAIARCDDRRFLDANPAFATFLGRPLEAVLSATDLDLGLWDASEDLRELYPIRRIRKRLCMIRDAAGGMHQAFCSTEPIVLNAQPCTLLILEDLTDLMQLEEQLRHAQKMESVGLLAAGVAHEFNNILTVIQGNVGMLQFGANEPEDVDYACVQVLDACDRAATLTSQLLAFSRKGMLQRRDLDLSGVVQSCRHMLSKLLGDEYNLQVDCADGMPHILADESSLVQVLMNLVANARDATPRNGTIQIRTAFEEVSETDASANRDAQPGAYGVLTVTDSGSGIDEQTIGRIFDPFFTTKERGRGTGLGLSMVLGIVKQHKGWIDVHTRTGEGTSFVIHLPVNSAKCGGKPAGIPAHAESDEIPTGNGETILVVEDEPQVLDLLRHVLVNHGYSVSVAANGREALEQYGSGNRPIDLLLTDVAMPGGINGDELARDLLALQPHLPIIFVSGYSPQALTQDVCQRLGAHFVRKPYTFAHLLRLIRKRLDQRAIPEVASPSFTAADRRR